MHRIALIWALLRRSGAEKVLLGFLMWYLCSAFVVMVFEPGIVGYGDALWFLWAVSTTVGLGDVTAITLVGRITAVLCSIYAVVTTAVITGVIVDYFNELRQQQLDQSLTEFLDKLERLPDLDQDELARISQRVRTFRTLNGKKRS